MSSKISNKKKIVVKRMLIRITKHNNNNNNNNKCKINPYLAQIVFIFNTNFPYKLRNKFS